MKTYFIKTYGCLANEADSEKIAASLERKGYRPAKKIEKADVVVINTCSVRESAENRAFGLVHNLQKLKIENSKLKTVLTGCMVSSARGKRQRYHFNKLKKRMSGVDEFKTLEELIGEDKVLPKRKDKTHALVPIMKGCDHFCSYCVVPYARGEQKSRSFEEIVCEVEELASQGYREITLLGQNVNSFGKDLKPSKSFARLLSRLHKIKGLQLIRFLTSNPWDLTDDIIKSLKLPKIEKHIHLPVQSGDDEILRKMNRPYTALQYIKLVEKIRREVPNIKITTDIIVGFPGETKKQFNNTVLLCRKIGFEKAYIARYSPRPGTAAFSLKDDVLPAEKKRRWRILDNLINL